MKTCRSPTASTSTSTPLAVRYFLPTSTLLIILLLPLEFSLTLALDQSADDNRQRQCDEAADDEHCIRVHRYLYAPIMTPARTRPMMMPSRTRPASCLNCCITTPAFW